VYQEFLPDGTRRVTEIIEVLGVKNGAIDYKTLVEFYVQDNILDPVTGEKKVIGDFIWRNPLSEKLQQKMLKKGATRRELTPYIRIGKE